MAVAGGHGVACGVAWLVLGYTSSDTWTGYCNKLELQYIEREMDTTPRGTPPNSPTMDLVVKELAIRTVEIATRPQLIDAVNKKTGKKVTDLAMARHFLEKSNLVASGGPRLRSWQTHYMPWRSSGEQIDNEVAQDIVDATAEAVGVAVSPIIEAVVTSQEDLKGSVEGPTGAFKAASTMVMESKWEMEALQVQVKEMREAMDKVPVAMTTAIPAGRRSYAAVAAVLARDTCKHKQILVNKASNMTVDTLASLSELELKEKANLVLTLMALKMEGAMFVGTKKLENRGVVYDCKTEEMAVKDFASVRLQLEYC
ncbi:hypothetical protein DFH08DRAFT_811641 [Mycena albidolilacea]|uniref:Uncharacterized protein n=1 Tax=Mycena albidolilacea TaxID=1033008 RepID=A0AAD6ZWQ6_9AGAR|nr:hypothetical protein DFH08DRAFT_811641 [Mycena albidolilacea]